MGRGRGGEQERKGPDRELGKGGCKIMHRTGIGRGWRDWESMHTTGIGKGWERLGVQKVGREKGGFTSWCAQEIPDFVVPAWLKHVIAANT